MQPNTAKNQPIKTKKITKQRHYLAVFFLSFMWGVFGVDRFYLGKYWTGLFKLITAGGFGLWAMYDLIVIMSGSMRDKQGRSMLQFAEYKRFSYLTVLIFAIALAVVVLINGILIIASITALIDSLQSGNGLPGLDSLLNGGSGGGDGLPPELQQYL